MSIEEEFKLIRMTDCEPEGITLGTFCLEAIVTFHQGNMSHHTTVERAKARECTKNILQAMVMLATDKCVDIVIAQMEADGTLGKSDHRQKARREAYVKKVRAKTLEGVEALAQYQTKAVKELFQILNRSVRLQAPLAVNAAEFRAIALMAYFYNIREQAESYIDTALGVKMITKADINNKK